MSPESILLRFVRDCAASPCCETPGCDAVNPYCTASEAKAALLEYRTARKAAR